MKKRSTRVKFNFVDFLIVAVVVALCVGAVFLLFGDRFSTNSDSVTVEYTIDVNTVYEEIANNVNIGDKVTDTVKAYALGEVVGTEIEDAYFVSYSQSKSNYDEKIPYPDHKKVSVTIRANAKDLGSKYSVNGYEISIGKKVSFRTPNFVATGYCTALSVVK